MRYTIIVAMSLLLCAYGQDAQNAQENTQVGQPTTPTTTQAVQTDDATQPLPPEANPSDENTAPPASLREVLSQDDRLSTLALLLAAGGLFEGLESGNYTIFAPSNYAFNVATENLADTLGDSTAVLDLLRGHVIMGALDSEMLTGGGELLNVTGSSLTVDATDGVRVNGAKVLVADIVAGNSIIHIIDSVILPE